MNEMFRVKNWSGLRSTVALSLGAVLAVPAAVAQGQQRAPSTVSTSLEREVEQLAAELMDRLRRQTDLSRSMQMLVRQLQMVRSDAEQRARTEEAIRRMQIRLESTGREVAELKVQLKGLCDADKAPEGWLGVSVQGNMDFVRSPDGIQHQFTDYPMIVSVEPGSPAAKAGVEAGDRLLVFDGRDVRGRNINFISSLTPGSEVTLRVRRGIETRTLTATIEPRPESFIPPPCPWVDQRIATLLSAPVGGYSYVITVESDSSGSGRKIVRRSPPSVAPEEPQVVGQRMPQPTPFVLLSPGTGTVAGAQMTSLNPDLSEALGVETGILVLKVVQGTPAQQSGLKGGDVIVSADGTVVTEPAALQRVINRADDRRIELVVVRKKKQQALTLEW